MPDDDFFDDVLNQPEPPGDEPAAEAAPESPTEEAPSEAPLASPAQDAPLILGKFRDQASLEQAYKELESQFHASRQPAQEPEPEQQAFDPFGVLEVAGDQLDQWSAQAPQDAFAWAYENQDQLGWQAQQRLDELYANWAMTNPYAAQKWLAQAEVATARQQWEAETQQRLAPLDTAYDKQAVGIAVGRANQELPNFAEYRERVLGAMQSNPGLVQMIEDDQTYRNPDALYQLIEWVFNQELAADYRAHMRAAAEQAAAEAAPAARAPQTQTRSTTTPPASTGQVDDLFPEGAFADRSVA